ncbi:serine hydrolase, partial [Micromonospora endophytica]
PPTPAELDAMPQQIRDVLASYHDPASLTVRALSPATEPIDLNRADLQTVQIPAVNGICTAHALARFYAALIGTVDGHRILDPSTLAVATAEQADGIDRVLHLPTRPALGFGLPLAGLPWWSPTAFGHGGHGGSLGYADPETGIAFGYVMNRLHVAAEPDPRAAGLITAVRASAAVAAPAGLDSAATR